MQQLDLVLDEVLVGAKQQTQSMIDEAVLFTGSNSTTMYNTMLSFGGLATGVRTVGFTAEQMKSWFDDSILGSTSLGSWVDTAFDNGVKQSLFDAIRKGGIEGKGTASIIKSLLQTALDEGIEITKREAITLTRTYIQAANIGAMQEVYRANTDLISGYEWVSALDNRTCMKMCSA